MIAGHRRKAAFGLKIVALGAVAFDPSPVVAEALWPLGHYGFGVLLHVATATFVGAATCCLVRHDTVLVDPRFRPAVLAAGIVTTVGSAIVPLGYLGRSVDFIAGFVEHAISTLLYFIWVVITCAGLAASSHGSGGGRTP